MMENPDCQDNDRRLISEIWRREMENFPGLDFVQAFETGKLTHPETIRRARQKIQQKFQLLRGKRYEERHNIQHIFLRELNCV